MNTPKTANGAAVALHAIVRAVSLFLSIVWRRWEEPRKGWPKHYACTYRLTIQDAWRIAWNIHRPNITITERDKTSQTTK
jgi:hypothetical protein